MSFTASTRAGGVFRRPGRRFQYRTRRHSRIGFGALTAACVLTLAPSAAASADPAASAVGRGPAKVTQASVSYGTPRGRAIISYSSRRRALTVIVSAGGVTPGPHAAHTHPGNCRSQGPVKYMLRDLTANGQPTIFFRPLICADIDSNTSVSPILRTRDIVTGVRGTRNGNVILTGSVTTGSGTQMAPFLYRGSLARAAAGAAVSLLTPPFPVVTSATFYGPDSHSFNPAAIPAGQVRAVGSYQSSSAPAGVVNQGMIYLGPVTGPGGSWKSIDVPADGAHTTGHVRACPLRRAHCYVMDTIAHSTMGNLVVGNYDLNPAVPGGVASGDAFIYNMTRRQWTLLRLGGSMSDLTTLYGIWQDGGSASPRYTLAGGSSDKGNQRAFLMNYNGRTGTFGKPRYYSYGNAPALFTHFDGITAVRGGFNLVATSSAQASSMAFVPVRVHGRRFGVAQWHPIPVAASPLCSGGCAKVTGNTVYRNHVMGIYVRTGSASIRSYLATVRHAGRLCRPRSQ